MPDETGTEATRSDAPGVDDSLFGDAVDDSTAAAVEEEGSKAEAPQDEQGLDDAGGQDAGNETAQDGKGVDDGGEVAAPSADLKVVVSIKGSRATIGVQQPSSDPHIETLDDLDESGLTQEVSAVIKRARARWEESPKHPTYQRPAPPPRRRNRRQQGAVQETNADTRESETEGQQQTLRLF